MKPAAGVKFSSLQLIKHNYQVVTLLAIWLAIQSILFWKNGIVTSLEATKYISQAEHFIETGSFTSDNYRLYATEILVIAAAIKFKTGYGIIVFVQLLLNLLATFMFYKLSTKILKNTFLSSVATLVLILNIPYQLYNSFLFTESIFYSLTIIYSSYLLRLKELTAGALVLLCSLLMILSITRPTGVLFFAATALYLLFRFFNRVSLVKKFMVFGSALVLFLIIINGMLRSGGSLDFMLPFKRENIICGVNTTATNANIKILEKGNSLQGLWYYLSNNHKQFLRLATLKTLAFYGLIRDYYSPFHNIVLMVFFYPFYILSLTGAWKMFRRKEPIVTYLLGIILLYWLTTLLTCDDWHNRFVLTVFPFIFLLGFFSFSKKTLAQNDQGKV